MFPIYFQLGFEHISDINAYDHILFIIALCVIYRPQDWKNILILVTAFTIGHSITLALAAFDIIRFSAKIIEFLIPVTILLTALSNFYQPSQSNLSAGHHFHENMKRNYWLALFFGLIHGMGFSNYLRELIMPGEERQLVVQLLAFNLGIELGQLLIVSLLFIAAFMVLNVGKLSQKWWVRIISGLIALWSIRLMIATFPF